MTERLDVTKTDVDCVVCGVGEIVQEQKLVEWTRGSMSKTYAPGVYFCSACGVQYHHVPDPKLLADTERAKGPPS